MIELKASSREDVGKIREGAEYLKLFENAGLSQGSPA